ncbi:MAG: DNA methylase [Bacteroidales bacterium]|nr:DNA methylase [Bacteroidales bacterium]
MHNNINNTYVAIDLKSFFASVECVERHLDPLTTNLVVADNTRTDKTICLAVTPSLKSYGISGRPRLFEVKEVVQQLNRERRRNLHGRNLTKKSTSDPELKTHTDWEIDFITATPRMATYLDYSQRVYNIYLKYIAPEDIHIYSVDEVFMDVTHYLQSYKMSAHELTMTIVRDVLKQTGITATAGIGTNLYLCKVAMDIVAKHLPADKDGVRIAQLDETSYRQQLWNHKPITAFWRIGHGIAQQLARIGIDTMGKLARCSIEHEDILYQFFGVNAEIIIDHAWGWEPCTIEEIKAYRPETNSLSNGQVLTKPYTFEKARVVIQEMADAVSLRLVSHQLVTDQLVIHVSYDATNLLPSNNTHYNGPTTINYYGKEVPKHAHGSITLQKPTSSTKAIIEAALEVFDRIANSELLIRRLNITANHVVNETTIQQDSTLQLNLFSNYEEERQKKATAEAQQQKERRMQDAILNIKTRYGKNALLKGLNFREGATAKERNQQIGGHKA